MSNTAESWRHALRSYVHERQLTTPPSRTGLEALPKLHMDRQTKEILVSMFVRHERLPKQTISNNNSNVSISTFPLRVKKADVDYLKSYLGGVYNDNDASVTSKVLPIPAMSSLDLFMLLNKR